METKFLVRFFGMGKELFKSTLFFSFLLCILGILVFSALKIEADLTIILPDSTTSGTSGQSTIFSCTGDATRAECLDDGTATSSNPGVGDDYLTFTDAQTDFYRMEDISGVATATVVQVDTYHVEGNGSMALFISLWDSSGTTQISATEIQLPNRFTGGAGWDRATFAGLNLTEGQLAGMQVRARCTRPGGGSKSTCRAYAMSADVTYTPLIDVAVSAAGTQQDLQIGTTSAYIGGQFVVQSNPGASSRDITTIRINENGTVDAQNDLANIELWFDTDTSGADGYDCSSESFDGNEIKYHSTVNSFDAANGTTTFSTTSPPSVSSTASLCFYVVLDVLDSASYTDNIEIRINDPSVNVVGSASALVEPNTAVSLPGTTNLLKTDFHQTYFHWRDESGTETSSNSATSQNYDVSLDLSQDDPKRLRLQVSNEGNLTSESTEFRLEYTRKFTDCSVETGWLDVNAVNDDWNLNTTSGLTHGGNTTDIDPTFGGMPNANSNFLGSNSGQRVTSSLTSALTFTSSDFVEFEFAVVASTTAVEGNAYCFRLIQLQGPSSSTIAYDTYAEATIAADLTVSGTSTQKATVDIPTSGVEAGGGFVITDSTPGNTHDISGITITASGTVDYQNHIDDIELWYDLDTVAPYDCTGEAFGDGEAEVQFGTTNTDGFSAAATSTFTTGSPVTVSTTQGMCLYIVYTATASTSDGETLDFQIANPATDIVRDIGSASPAAVVDIAGVTTFVTDIATQVHYHFREDTGAEGSPGGAPSATGGNEDTPFDATTQLLTKELPVRLRFGISNEGGSTTPGIQYRFEYAQKISTCENISSWTEVGVGPVFSMFSSTWLTNNTNTTDIPVSTGGVSDEAGTFLTANQGQKTTSETNAIALPGNQYFDIEYAFQATANAVSGATYCFRVSNAGADLDDYWNYPEATIKLDTDFFVQRNVLTISTTSKTLVAGKDYDAPSASTSAFIRITNTNYTGAGPDTGTSLSNADDVTAYIEDPWNIENSVTFSRLGASGNTRVAWEIVEYKGSPGGENEMIVRQQQFATYGAGTTVLGPAINTINDNDDVVVFITGQANPNTGRNNYNTVLSTSQWASTTNQASFTRSEDGGDAVIVSYAVVEFTGTNWFVQRTADFTHTTLVASEPVSIPQSITAIDRAFIHAQHRTTIDTHAGFGAQAWLSGTDQVSVQLDTGAGTAADHVSVIWVIENTQPTGDVMEVAQFDGPQSGGVAPVTSYADIGITIDDITVASLSINNTGSGATRSWPEPILSYRIASTTAVEVWVSDNTDTQYYRGEIIEWPTAKRKITQNDFYFFANNNALTPSDPWPPGAGDIGENSEIDGLSTPLASGDTIRIRMNLEISAGAMPPGVDAFKLQYVERPGQTCTGLTGWRSLGNIGSTTALWRGTTTPIADGATLDGGSLILSESDIAGTFEEENNTALTPNLVLVGESVEFDWAIENNGAPDKTSYCFRMIESDGTLLLGWNTYPVIRTAGYGAQSQEWKWFDDSENETPLTELAASNTAPVDIDFDDEIQLRMVLREVNGADGTNVKFRLQFSEYADFSTSTYVSDIGNCVDGESLWCYADGGGVDNATITTRLLVEEADPCTGGVGAGCGTHNESGTSSTTSDHIHQAGDASEFAFTLRHAGARVNRVYYFRVYDEANAELVPLAADNSYPSLVTKGASLTFAMTGIASSTNIEGVVTDIDTTPVLIDYGSLPFGTELEAAHRLSIDTNGTEGYQVLMFSQGDFLNGFGTKIQPVLATNAAPAGWSSLSGCPEDADGCFGYHAGDNSLGTGNQSRFFADDTYARFSSTTPEEIAYSSSPAANENIDIIYKLKVNKQQEAGQYETNVVYIAIPIF